MSGRTDEDVVNEEKPYLEEVITYTEYSYNKNYGDNRICECGHTYYRHFDSYEHMKNVGCKYCRCDHFKEKEKDKENGEQT